MVNNDIDANCSQSFPAFTGFGIVFGINISNFGGNCLNLSWHDLYEETRFISLEFSKSF